MSAPGIVISGLGGASALGGDIAAQAAAMSRPVAPLRPLAAHPEMGGEFPELLAGWIDDRSWLAGRKYGGASNAAVRAARTAVAEAGWTPAEMAGCHVFCSTSRGNTGTPNPPGLTRPTGVDFALPTAALPFAPDDCLLKLAVGMGGRNAVVVLSI